MTDQGWASCRNCPHGADVHDAVIIEPVAVDPGDRVLFSGTLGACRAEHCKCSMYSHNPVPVDRTVRPAIGRELAGVEDG